ncbi:MAG: hypothetical protein AAGI12_12525 [Pseudomonadota bacterium]
MTIVKKTTIIALCLGGMTATAHAANEPYSGTDQGTPLTQTLPEIVDRHLAADVSGNAVRILKNGCYIFEYQDKLYQIIDGDGAKVCTKQ